MKNNYLKYVLVLLTLTLSFATWLSVERAINLPAASVWLAPIIWSSLTFLFIGLDLVIIKDKKILFITFVVSYALSFLFSFELTRLLFFLLAMLSLLWAEKKIKDDLAERIKINLGYTLGIARSLVVISLCFVISSQYYTDIKNSPQSVAVPKFEPGKFSTQIGMKMLSLTNPELEKVSDGNLTVDEFIEKSQTAALENTDQLVEAEVDRTIKQQGQKNITSLERERIKKQVVEQLSLSEEGNAQLSIAQGKLQFSEMLGRDVSGEEKMGDILSELVSQKVNEIFQPKVTEKNQGTLWPVILAGLLFLTIFPLLPTLS